METSRKRPTVIDLFCGAGGFSEGFRQAGFEIVGGYDIWKPAASTFALNHGGTPNVLDLAGANCGTDLIDSLPNTDVIIGSPPCVSFSTSNKMGKADKSQGIKLIQAFLRVVAVKKHRPQSKLKAWFFENVPNVQGSLKNQYTFAELELAKWARNQGLNPNAVAINCGDAGVVVDSSELGGPQRRKRFFAGEVIGGLTLSKAAAEGKLRHPSWITTRKTMRGLLEALGAPNTVDKQQLIVDPIYKVLSLRITDVTDHYYDTSIHNCHAEECRRLKQNHPYMGRMAFPDDSDRSCRTITATDMPRSREAIILPSEWRHRRNGMYRTLTVREAACLMGFPISYQFLGGRSTKWKLVGNAVCPTTAAAIGNFVNVSIGAGFHKSPAFRIPDLPPSFENLNTFTRTKIAEPAPRRVGARFRRHPLKSQNITVALTNYYLGEGVRRVNGKWYAFIVTGTGKNFEKKRVTSRLTDAALTSLNQTRGAPELVQKLEADILCRLPSPEEFQQLFESRAASSNAVCPNQVIDLIEHEVAAIAFQRLDDGVSRKVFGKVGVSLSQLVTVYVLGRVAQTLSGGT